MGMSVRARESNGRRPRVRWVREWGIWGGSCCPPQNIFIFVSQNYVFWCYVYNKKKQILKSEGIRAIGQNILKQYKTNAFGHTVKTEKICIFRRNPSWRFRLLPWAPYPVVLRRSSLVVVHHKVSGSHGLRSVWSIISKVYMDIQTGFPYSHTGYDVIESLSLVMIAIGCHLEIGLPSMPTSDRSSHRLHRLSTAV